MHLTASFTKAQVQLTTAAVILTKAHRKCARPSRQPFTSPITKGDASC